MASNFSSSTSPQWDNRNRGFISPSELQQLRQASPGRAFEIHDLSARPPAETSTPDNNPSQSHPQPFHSPSDPQPRPPNMPAATPQSHARTSSFFSFRHKQSPQEQQPHEISHKRPGSSSGPPPSDFGPPAPPMGQSKSMGPGRPSPDVEQPDRSQQQQQQSAVRSSSLTGGQPPPPLHPEIRSVVQLTLAHARKIYFSGPLLKRIERMPDGQRPTKDDGWVDVWAQLGGTTLSIWDMREVEEANKQGREVPPVYLNITDAFVQVLGAITMPAVGEQPGRKYTNVLTLNTAGSNLLLFSCSSTQALISWATALRLASWEKSRLEEIYTAHLIRITLPSGKDTRSALLRGRMEGWVRIRVSGQTDWKRMWMVISASSGSSSDLARTSSNDGGRPSAAEAPRKKRMSNLFSRDHQDEPLPQRPLLSLYASPKSKDRKQPLLTLKEVSQAFAVYPERPELISRSTLMKLEGFLGDEETGGSMRNRQGWLLIMPELEAGNTQPSEMLKWLVAVHDAFELYGRPKSYTWDPREQSSMMFGYPVGPGKELLFLDRELAEKMDPREDRTSAVRARLLGILAERMSIVDPAAHKDGPPALPPLGLSAGAPIQQQVPMAPDRSNQVNGDNPLLHQLPLLSFDTPSQPQPQVQPMIPVPRQESTVGRVLTPIVERTHSQTDSLGATRSRAPSDENIPLASMVGSSSVLHEGVEDGSRFGPPRSASPAPGNVESRSPSDETQRAPAVSRPDSKLALGETPQTRLENTGSNGTVEVMGVKLPFSPPTSPEIPSFSTTPTAFSSPQSSPLDRRSPYQTPGSPGLHGPSAAPPSTPGRTRSPVPASPPFTVLTSPHSVLEKDLPSIQAVQTQAQETPQRLSSPPVPSRSPGRNPYVSPSPVPPVPDKPTSPLLTPAAPPAAAPAKPSPAQDAQNENDFTAALYYMQQFEEKPPPPRRVPTTISEGSEISPTSSEDPQPSSQVHSSMSSRFAASQPLLRGAGGGILGSEGSLSSSRAPLGRKPSGARAPTNSRVLNLDTSSHPSSPERPHVPNDEFDAMPNNSKSTLSHTDDVNADALAALSFLDHVPSMAPPQRAPDVPATKLVPSPPPRQQESPHSSENAPVSSENATQYRSSFALSKQAAERKARVQAQQAAHQAAVHRPGRANGKRSVSGPRAGAWNDSSEEEDEDEEEEDDADSDSDNKPSTLDSKRPSRAPAPPPAPAPASVPDSAQASFPAPVPTAPIRPLRPHSRNASPAEVAAATDANPYAQLRHPRNLPPVPRPQTQGPTGVPEDYFSGTPPARRIVSDQRARTPDDGAVVRSHSDFPAPPPPTQRQNIWTQVLEPGRQPGANPVPEAPPPPQRDTFIQLEPTSVSMTKAFTPHGLLSAGMQDKQDRSAKRQEELARETGASLINVPNKPPPPQTGLLGAITAHERDRKREGGVGATLTEREREKRLAEDRQRKLDEFQRQQLEMAQSGMYGGQPSFQNFNPMMPNPMMMGMNPMMAAPNPMMTGGFMGYPGMVPGYGAQQYMLAQQAAQAAYQQAMMAFATGSVPDGMHSGPAPMSPMMTGGGMGFDPRMSMMGMPMMSSPMPMGGMGMPMGTMPGMGGMGMQMTGGSGFDPRFSAGGLDENLRPPGPPGGQQGPGHNSSRNSSAGQGSPAGLRAVDATGDRQRDSLKS